MQRTKFPKGKFRTKDYIGLGSTQTFHTRTAPICTHTHTVKLKMKIASSHFLRIGGIDLIPSSNRRRHFNALTELTHDSITMKPFITTHTSVRYRFVFVLHVSLCGGTK